MSNSDLYAYGAQVISDIQKAYLEIDLEREISIEKYKGMDAIMMMGYEVPDNRRYHPEMINAVIDIVNDIDKYNYQEGLKLSINELSKLDRCFLIEYQRFKEKYWYEKYGHKIIDKLDNHLIEESLKQLKNQNLITEVEFDDLNKFCVDKKDNTTKDVDKSIENLEKTSVIYKNFKRKLEEQFYESLKEQNFYKCLMKEKGDNLKYLNGLESRAKKDLCGAVLDKFESKEEKIKSKGLSIFKTKSCITDDQYHQFRKVVNGKSNVNPIILLCILITLEYPVKRILNILYRKVGYIYSAGSAKQILIDRVIAWLVFNDFPKNNISVLDLNLYIESRKYDEDDEALFKMFKKLKYLGNHIERIANYCEKYIMDYLTTKEKEGIYKYIFDMITNHNESGMVLIDEEKRLEAILAYIKEYVKYIDKNIIDEEILNILTYILDNIHLFENIVKIIELLEKKLKNKKVLDKYWDDLIVFIVGFVNYSKYSENKEFCYNVLKESNIKCKNQIINCIESNETIEKTYFYGEIIDKLDDVFNNPEEEIYYRR